MIDHIDHLVLTTHDEQACINFYVNVLGMTLDTFGEGRKAVKFGAQKINLHIKGQEFEPKAHCPMPGALDLCFITSQPLEAVMVQLRAHDIAVIEGPARRTGANYPLCSIYVRDPDLNLIEIAVKDPQA